MVCSIPSIDWKDTTLNQKWGDVLSYCDLIEENSARTELDPILIASLIMQESGGDANSISSSGAVGLMQIMPRDGIATQFMCVNGPCFATRPTIEELLNPNFNIEYGSNFLSGLISKHGVREGLFRYGPAEVGYTYADKVLKIFKLVKDET